MTDCEWQLRQMQRQCKDKTDKSNYERKQATAKAEELELELQSRRRESEMLRTCQAQVNSLRGVVSEQEQSIQTLMDRIENLKEIYSRPMKTSRPRSRRCTRSSISVISAFN